MTEPIPHPVRPHNTQHYLTADGRAETDRDGQVNVNLHGRHLRTILAPFGPVECSIRRALYDKLLAPSVNYFPLGV